MSIPKILMIDDEENILNSLQRLLRQESYEITTTTSPHQAVELLEKESFAVILSDQRMPIMEGTQVLEQAQKVSPNTVRILLTGYVDIQSAIEAINRGSVYRFLTKPWNEEEIRLTLRQAVSHFELTTENKRLEALTQQQNEQLVQFNQNLEKKVAERTAEVSRLNQELKNTFMGSVQVMASLAEMHSTVVGSHSKRVAVLCHKIAVQMGCNENTVSQIMVAGILHDIGKISIPEEILNKPTNMLKPQEAKLLERHALQGEAIVRMVPNLHEAALYVRHHHELFGGNGYPEKLRGTDIPLGSRIIAVVDAYDKVLNSRPNFAWATPEKAIQVLQNRCPSEFDPEIVAALMRCFQEEPTLLGEKDEVEIMARDLKEGMVLSRDLVTVRGVLLLPKASKVEREQLALLIRFLEVDPAMEGIYIHRQTTAPETAIAETA